jgi:hypothetical protein
VVILFSNMHIHTYNATQLSVGIPVAKTVERCSGGLVDGAAIARTIVFY